MSATAYIALGANLGDRLRTFNSAACDIVEHPSISIVNCSNLYETTPVGGPKQQPDYLNAVISVQTELPPRDLLASLLQVESLHHRMRSKRNGPRTLDLDLLLYDDEVLANAFLQIPHPRLYLRKFVLKPLSDVAPDLVHPLLKLSVKHLLDQLESEEIIRQVAGRQWLTEGFAVSDSATRNPKPPSRSPAGRR